MRRALLAFALLLAACGGDDEAPATSDDAAPPLADAAASDAAAPPIADAAVPDAASPDAAFPDATPDASRPPPRPDRALIASEIGRFALRPFEETQLCAAWTLHNEAPLYVQRVRLANDGALHHSNWFVVPEAEYAGPDGLFRCSSRDFDEVRAAMRGTVLFAQSTQAAYEEQDLGEGVVVKIPPRHKVVVQVHLLNLAGSARETRLRLGLEAVHPTAVRTVVTPFRMTYQPIDVPPRSEARVTSECDMAASYERMARRPFDLKLYWLLPHYHSLGNHFRVEVVGGPRDGEVLLDVGEFDGEASGKAFRPAVDLTGARGLRLTCGYRNPRDERVEWGYGDGEMCDLLGFADSAVLMDAGVYLNPRVVGTQEGITYATGPCTVVTLPKNAAQTMPTPDEDAAPLNVPPSPLEPGELAGPPPCADTPPDAVADASPALGLLRRDMFLPSCSFNACHGPETPAAGLDLASAGLRERLLAHRPTGRTDLPLVAPGDPEGSWLYRKVSRCVPADGESHMPLNNPTLLDPALVARLRDWIAAGSPDD